ncbi:Uncharacterised protein [Vibrio cholerae]|nr:Uncharacterised protein [Vibrio cholerae]
MRKSTPTTTSSLFPAINVLMSGQMMMSCCCSEILKKRVD